MKIAIIVVSVIALVLVGICLYLLDANKKLALKANDLEEQRAAVAAELEARIAAISQEKEDEIARLRGTYDELVTSM